MSEVEKMYKNAGVEKQYYYFDSADGNTYTWELNENGNDKHNMCFIGKPKIKDREFAPEKQLELIKWLGKLDGKLEITCTYNKEKFIFYFYFNRKTDKNPDPKYPYSNFLNADIEILIASIINDIWQDLTESEQEQIKRILE